MALAKMRACARIMRAREARSLITRIVWPLWRHRDRFRKAAERLDDVKKAQQDFGRDAGALRRADELDHLGLIHKKPPNFCAIPQHQISRGNTQYASGMDAAAMASKNRVDTRNVGRGFRRVQVPFAELSSIADKAELRRLGRPFEGQPISE
jgi:hypothetical protein